jgi:hypothetical protein
VTFTLTPAQFALWDNGRWRIETGEIRLTTGASSANIRASGAFRITAPGWGREPPAAILTPTSEVPVR